MDLRDFSLHKKSRRNKAPGLPVISIVVSLLVIMAAGLGWGLYWDHRSTLDRADSRLQLQLRAFSNTFDMAFVGADHALREVREELEESEDLIVDPSLLRQRMFRHMLKTPYLSHLTLYDLNGSEAMSVGEKPELGPGLPVWLEQMIQGRVQSKVTIKGGQLTVALLVERRNAGPMGVLVASLDRDSVISQLETGGLYSHQQLYVVDTDHHVELVAEGVEPTDSTTASLLQSLQLDDFESRNQSLEKDGHLIAIRQLTQQPLRALALLEKSHVLQPWKQRLGVAAAGFSMLTLLSLAFLRYWHRSASREYQASNDLYHLYQAVEQMPSSVIVTDLNNDIMYVNSTYLERTGYAMQEVLGQKPAIFASGLTPDSTTQSLEHALKRGLAWEGEVINQMKDGRQRIEQQLISPVYNVDGEVSSYIAISTDVTEKRDAEKRLIRYREIVNVSDELLAMVGADYRYQQVNRQHELYLGLTRDQIEGRSLSDIYGEEEFYQAIKPFIDRILRGETVVEEKWVEFGGIGKRFCRITGKPIRDNGDRIETTAVSMVDLTARRESEEALSISETRFRTLSENLPQGLFEADDSGRLLYANRRCGEIFGRALDELAEGEWLNALLQEDRQRVAVSWRQCIAAGQKQWRIKARLHTPRGEQRWISLFAKRYQSKNQTESRYIGTLRDITEETLSRELLERKNKELERLSTTDMLTGLVNRSHLEQLLDAEVHRFERYGACCSVIMLDVDHFKAVNDTCGHAVGDEVLRRIGSLLTTSTRRSDHAGRWGGEEFVVVCPHTTVEGAKQLAEELRRRIAAVDFPVVGQKTCSLGVAGLRPGDGSHELLSRADAALYRAKNAGRNRVDVERGVTVV